MTAITRLLNSFWSAFHSLVNHNCTYSDRRELSAVPAVQLRCLVIYQIPHYISSFSCTRSVRLFVGYVTKWHTCLPNITILFSSFANGVRLGCVTGDRSSSFSIFLLANFPWKCTYSTSRGGYFYTFLLVFALIWHLLQIACIYCIFLHIIRRWRP